MVAKTIKDMIKHYYTVEGGYVHNVDDLGGATGAGGITEGLAIEYKHLWAKHGFTGDMCNFPYSLYEEIMMVHFVEKYWLDDIFAVSPRIADCMYGWAINSGAKYPILALQKHLNAFNLKEERYKDVTVDGYMGNQTLTALKQYMETCKCRQPASKACETIMSYQHVHYIDISNSREANETFTDGWLNRVMEKGKRLLGVE